MRYADLRPVLLVSVEQPSNLGGILEKSTTLPKTNIAPETGWSEDEIPFGNAYFQGLY